MTAAITRVPRISPFVQSFPQQTFRDRPDWLIEWHARDAHTLPQDTLWRKCLWSWNMPEKHLAPNNVHMQQRIRAIRRDLMYPGLSMTDADAANVVETYLQFCVQRFEETGDASWMLIDGSMFHKNWAPRPDGTGERRIAGDMFIYFADLYYINILTDCHIWLDRRSKVEFLGTWEARLLKAHSILREIHVRKRDEQMPLVLGLPHIRAVREGERVTDWDNDVRAAVTLPNGSLVWYKDDGTEVVAEPDSDEWVETGNVNLARRVMIDDVEKTNYVGHFDGQRELMEVGSTPQQQSGGLASHATASVAPSGSGIGGNVATALGVVGGASAMTMLSYFALSNTDNYSLIQQQLQMSRKR